MHAVVQGMSQAEAARTFGVARGTVNRWMQEYRREGEAALDIRRRGRPPAPRLSGDEAEGIVELLMQHPPDELGLPFPVRTIGRYLRSWGLTPQKPARQATEAFSSITAPVPTGMSV